MIQRLKNKNIYYIITGAKKATLALKIINNLKKEGANVFVIPTKSALNFIEAKKLKDNKKNVVKKDWSEKITLPEEDAILISPCTFNTLNSIASGLANSFPLCIIAAAIGRKIPVFISPAMNHDLWNNPITQKSINQLESFGCKFIFPKITKNKVTMMDYKKVLDTIYCNFNRINFNDIKDNQFNTKKLDKYRNDYFKYFKEIGTFLKKNNFNLYSAGCMSIKVKDGLLITSTGNDLSNLKKENISLITSWNKTKNIIKWNGTFLPSSESPLNCIISNKKNVKFILHIHNPKITYNNKLNKYVTNSYQHYGTFNLGQQTVDKLSKEEFCILKYHGEIITGDNINNLKKIIKKFNNI